MLAPTPKTASDDAKIVWSTTALLLVVYGALAIAGQVLFITKTVMLPIFVLYGALHRERVAFVRDWAPFMAATLLFDALRGFVFVLTEIGVRPVLRSYVIVFEWLVTGTPALTLPLQAQWRSPVLDRFFVAWHGTHFLVFLLFGLVVWHCRRPDFWRYRAACLGVMFVGIAAYFLVPTVPPWLASQQGALPPLAAIGRDLYATGIVPLVIIQALDTNPVAAMPSLHMAFPVVCAALAWRLFGRIAGAAFALYAAIQAIGLIYLGEHYFVDVVAGVIVALLIGWEVNRHEPARVLTLPRALTHAAMLFCGSVTAHLAAALLH